MSLILDALRRAERERQAAHSPFLAQATVEAPTPGAAPWLRRTLLGMVLVALLAGALWWTSRETAAPPAETAHAPAPPEPPPQPVPPRDTVKMEEAQPAATVLPGTESVATLDDLGPEASVAVTPEPEDRPAQTPAAAPATPAPESEAAQAPPKQAPEHTEEEKGPAEPDDDPPVPAALMQPAPLRTLREMPPAYRADFPAISVEVHVYEKQPARRFVIVNGRRYREGERLAEGPGIVEIVRGGIVFEYRGERVLYTLTR